MVIKENGAIISNQKVVSNKFNNYFVSVAQNSLKELGEPNNKFQVYLNDPNTHSFFLKAYLRYKTIFCHKVAFDV